jgi:hypothetical protein
MRRLAVIAVAAALAGGCKKESKDAEKSSKPIDAPPIALSVDGFSFGRIDAGKAGTWAPLGSFLPEGKQDIESWASIEPEPGEPIDEPAKKHPGLVAAVYPGKKGIAFGFFAPEDLAKKGAPQWSIDPVTGIAITTHERKKEMGGQGGTGGQGGGDGEGGGGEDDGERPTPTADLKITVVGPAGESVFTGDKLAALPTSTAPIGDTDTPGWTLLQVIEAAGAKPTAKVIVYGEEGANLILEGDTLDPAKATLFIKLNRSGQLRFRAFKKVGSTWETVGELRGISRIEMK